MRIRAWLMLFAALLSTGLGHAQIAPTIPRQNVTFQITQTTSPGQSVFVLGSIPELGAGDVRFAVKLDPSAYPIWRATVAIPLSTAYTYQFYLRSDAPGQTSLTQGTPIGSVISASTAAAPHPAPGAKTVFLTWDIPRPVLWWRQGSAPFAAVPMQVWGPAVAGRPQDTQHFVPAVGIAGRAIDFYFTDDLGASRYPSTGFYSTPLDGFFVQEGQIYTYVPPAALTPGQRNYNPASPPTLFSPELSDTRGIRVWLPRGYAENSTRRYPVLYFHDGQNIFENGLGGTWNAGNILNDLVARGQMREAIIVGVDNVGSTRLSDYRPPQDLGRGDLYSAFLRDRVKPSIDATYRTLTDRASTAVIGSSMGGVISLYIGYDFTSFASRIGAFSTAWQTIPTYTPVVRGNTRDLRIYLDTGDSGASNDNYWPSYTTRDAWATGLAPRYALEGSLRFVVGYGQAHNEVAWAARLPQCYTFLMPPQEDTNEILRGRYNATLDINTNGLADIDDLYAQSAQPRDLNLDGAITPADDALLQGALRRGPGLR